MYVRKFAHVLIHKTKTVNIYITKSFFAALAVLVCVASCNKTVYPSVQDRQFILNGNSTYYVGTNLWYAGRLAQTEEGRERLVRELDLLHSMGVDNLRILAVEGEDLDALQWALDAMQERHMYGVLYLNNAWEWSYGYADYMERAGAGRQPRPSTDGYQAYMTAMAGFPTNKEAVALNQQYVAKVVERFKNHKAIWSWQLSNEPRCFSDDWYVQDCFVEYIHSTAALIKSIDRNHMVCTGNEGTKGCEESMHLCKRINNCPDIDYITVHIWPYNWGWAKEGSIEEGADQAIEKVAEYINQHVELGYILNKPVVISEFGYPRDGFQFAKGTPTTGRDKIYNYVFSRVIESAQQGGQLAGCNFWGWGGYANQTPGHIWWEEGDDLCNDPAQEQQGLNSVYACDESTVEIIRNANRSLQTLRMEVPMQHDWMFTGHQSRKLKANVYAKPGETVSLACHFVSDTTLMTRRDTVLSVFKQARTNKAGKASISIDFPSLGPGFYQANISYSTEGSEAISYNQFNIGIEPEQIISPMDRQPDFEQFWAQTLQELSEVPLNLKMTYVPEHSNQLRKSYLVEADSWNGGKIGGYLCVPAKEGKFPVQVNYMGYGADCYWFDPSAKPETVEFLVSVRDQGIFRGQQSRWIDRGLESKETFYYRGAFADVVRAVDLVCSLDCADTDKVYAWGESQGGAFTLAAAALDSRIKAAAPAVPFLGDFRDYAKIVWWPVWEVLETADAQGLDREELYTMLSYFDIKNFMDKVQCPVYMGFGLQDPTCPPHTNFSEYNLINTDKHYYTAPRCGHGIWQIMEWERLRNEWFNSLLTK